MKEPEPVKIYTYELPGGWIVLAGRTDADNERLSIKLADPRDWWFHVRGMSGSHVLLKYRPEQAGGTGPDNTQGSRGHCRLAQQGAQRRRCAGVLHAGLQCEQAARSTHWHGINPQRARAQGPPGTA